MNRAVSGTLFLFGSRQSFGLYGSLLATSMDAFLKWLSSGRGMRNSGSHISPLSLMVENTPLLRGSRPKFGSGCAHAKSGLERTTQSKLTDLRRS